jgi:hypothetical protein
LNTFVCEQKRFMISHYFVSRPINLQLNKIEASCYHFFFFFILRSRNANPTNITKVYTQLDPYNKIYLHNIVRCYERPAIDHFYGLKFQESCTAKNMPLSSKDFQCNTIYFIFFYSANFQYSTSKEKKFKKFESRLKALKDSFK